MSARYTYSRSNLRHWAQDLGWAYNDIDRDQAQIFHPLYGTDGEGMDSNDSRILVLYAEGGAVLRAYLFNGSGERAVVTQIRGGVREVVKLMIFQSHYASDTGCPFPNNCQHTTDVDGESCECCGHEITEGHP